MTSLVSSNLSSPTLDYAAATHAPSKPQSEDNAELTLLRFATFDDALPIREEWDQFVERVGGDIFNTFDWCAAWWKHFGRGRTLALFVAKNGNDLVATWPLFRETLWWGPAFLRVVRVVGCDHGVTTCNLCTDPDLAGAVALRATQALEREAPWDLLHVGEIPGYAQHVSELADAFRQSPHVAQVRWDDQAYPHAVFDVPSDYETYLAGLSLKERRNVRHDERELSKQGGTFVEPGVPESIDAALDVLIKLHQKHWAARGRHGLFHDVPGIEAFHRDLARVCAQHGRLAFVEVRNRNGVLASEYALRFNGRLHWIIGGRRENVSSRIGFCALMHNAVRDQLAMIDGLPGEYDYKRRLGARSLAIKTLFVFPCSHRGRIRLPLARWAAQLASLIYHRAWYWHAAPWLTKRAPRLSSIFIRPGVWERFARSKFLVVGRASKKETTGTPSSGETTET